MPEQVKFFGPDSVENVETAINDWLSANPTLQILDRKMDMAANPGFPPSVAVSIWYRQ